MTGSSGSGWREHVLLFSRFVCNPRAVGAIAPSSRALADAMVDGVDLAGPLHVVELGPGTGVFTSALMARLGPEASLFAIDRESCFVERLKQRWPHLEAVCASAADLPTLVAERHLAPVDLILSGLPFASLPVAVTQQILDGIQRTLRPGGLFCTFQYVHAYRMPPAVAFRRRIDELLECESTRRLVMRNVPPAYVLRWVKRCSPDL